MTEQTSNNNPNPEQGQPQQTQSETPQKVIFTPEQQEAVNRLIADRLAQERKSQEKKDAERQKQAEIEKLSGEEKLRAQHKAEVDKILAERDEAVNASLRLKAEKAVAELGYDTVLADYVIDADDDAMKKKVKALDEAINKAVESKVQANLSHGAPKTGGSGGQQESQLDYMRRVARLKV